MFEVLQQEIAESNCNSKYFMALFSQSTFGRLLLLHILLFAESTSALKYYSRPGFFLFPLNIFRANNVDHWLVAITGVPRELVVTELIYC